MFEAQNLKWGCKKDTHRAQPSAGRHPKLAKALQDGLPEDFDLAQWQPPRPNQGPTGACTAHAFGGAVSTALRFKGTPLPWESSEDLIYKTTRAFARAVVYPMGMLPPLSDDGAELGVVVASTGIYGVAARGDLVDGRVSDVGVANINDEPDFDKLEEASQHLIVGSHRILTNDPSASTLCAAALVAGFPILVGFFADTAFMQLGVGKIAVAPDLSDPKGGGHAVYLSGFKTMDNRRVFILTNSWGNSWCDNGQCLVDDEWLSRCWDLLVADVKAVTPLAVDPLDVTPLAA